MTDVAELEISLTPVPSQNDTYTVDMRLRHVGSDSVERPLTDPKPQVTFTTSQHFPGNPAYGLWLGQTLWSNADVLRHTDRLFQLAAAAKNPVRFQLVLPVDLHDLHWETLRLPTQDIPITRLEQVWFSRYLSDRDGRPVYLADRTAQKALVVIANPTNPEKYKLTPLDMAAEESRARATLGDLPTTWLMQPPESHLPRLIETLRQGFTVLYLVCHGRMGKDGPWLYLADEHGVMKPTRGRDLVAGFKELPHPPSLVILISCQSAGAEQGADALSALGPRLAHEANIPAVLAMQGQVTKTTMDGFMPMFGQTLWQDGLIDQAIARARGVVRDAPDWWMPVLFTRLAQGRVWRQDGLWTTSPTRLHLPLDAVPAPGALPPGSRLALAHNPYFVGRERELLALARALQEGQTAAVSEAVAVTGLGGIGKSQLAAAFAHRYGRGFAGGVYWLNMANPADVPTEVAECGRAMNPPPHLKDAPLDDLIAWTEQQWQSPTPRLLIFDNCEEMAVLNRWRPREGGCRVLVTSRNRRWDVGLGLAHIPLTTLPRAESVALLRRLRDGQKHTVESAPPVITKDDDILAQIAAALGDLPLALHLAGSYLHSYPHDPFGQPQQYLADLLAEGLAHPSLEGDGTDYSPTEHDRHVGRTFALSWRRLDEQDETDRLAVALLARAACLASGEPIPRPLLLLTADIEAEDSQQSRQGAKALGRLVGLGLLEENETGDLLIHRLVAAFVREQQADDQAQTSVATALRQRANRLNNAGYPAPLLVWQSHLRYVTDQALQHKDETAAGLASSLGFHLQMIGQYAAARPYYERALAIREKALGPDHPDTAGSLNNLGFLLQAMGDLAAARPYLERALAITEKALGPDHPDTARSLNNLGALLDSMGDLTAARPYLERAVAITEEALGPDHPSTATSLNNLGTLLQAMGDLAAARPYYERALAIREKALGPDHPDTATSLNNLGFLLQAMGDYAAARPYLERALAIYEKALGPDHPDTALSLNNLGTLLKAMGDYAAARPYYERALAIHEKALGPDHPDTAQSLNNLGTLLQAMGDLAAARPYLERALAINEKALGPDHPDTAQSLNNLGFLLQAWGIMRRRDRTTNAPWRSEKRRWGQTTPTPPGASTTWAFCSIPWGIMRRRDRTTNAPWRSKKRRWGQTTPTPPAASSTWVVCSTPWGICGGATVLRTRPGDSRKGIGARPPRHRPQPQQPGNLMFLRGGFTGFSRLFAPGFADIRKAAWPQPS
ncbi:MAG: tetratricopeptide repeat protein [Chloroflexi bacterium]|nr:tetratricopeptide repeat protein [Chloroflexota bacterium]